MLFRECVIHVGVHHNDWSATGGAETCQNSYVQFEAANLLRDGLLREWKQLPPEATTELKNYLLNYLVGHAAAPGFLRERLVQVSLRRPTDRLRRNAAAGGAEFSLRAPPDVYQSL